MPRPSKSLLQNPLPRTSRLAIALLLSIAGCLGEPQDEDLLEVTCPDILDEWIPGIDYESGDIVSFQGRTFTCIQGHTKAASDWTPSAVPALWSPAVCEGGVQPPVQPPAEQPPAEQPPAGQFPAIIDARFFQMDLTFAGAAGQVGNAKAQFDVVGAVGRAGVEELARIAVTAAVTTERDAQGQLVEVRRASFGGQTFESRQTFVAGVQSGTIQVGAVRRYQFTRNFDTGGFEGILVGSASDKNAPLAAIVTPLGNGDARAILIADLGNNTTNDLRAEIVVTAASSIDQSARVLSPRTFTNFVQFNGGLAAQPESAALVRKLAFPGLKGF